MKEIETFDKIASSLSQPLWNQWRIRERLSCDEESAIYRMDNLSYESSLLRIKLTVANNSLFFDPKSKEAYVERKRVFANEEIVAMQKLRNSPYILCHKDELISDYVVNGNRVGFYRLIRTDDFPDAVNAISSGRFKPTERNVLMLANHIAQALRVAHSNKIIHCDISLSNIFLGNDGVFRLGNFAFIKQLPENRNIPCMAPEVYHTKTLNTEYFTEQSDIYALGICLYTLMNNLRRPFEENLNPTDAFAKRMNGDAFLPPVNASPKFADIIMRACCFDVQQRYKSVADMLNHISDILLADNPNPPQNAVPTPMGGGQIPPYQNFNGNQKPPQNMYEQAEEKKSNNGIIALLIVGIVAVIAAIIIVIVSMSGNSWGGGYTVPASGNSSQHEEEEAQQPSTAMTTAATTAATTTTTTTVTTTTVQPATKATTITTTVPPATKPPQPSGTTDSATAGTEVFVIRRSWSDSASQIGQYTNLEQAKKSCPAGYSVFNSRGKALYSVQAATNPPPTEPLLWSVGAVVTDRGNLNVRSGPGTEYSKVGSLPCDTIVYILDYSNGWYYIEYDGSYGYVSAEFIRLIN